MAIYIPGAKAGGGGGVSTLWFDPNETYPADSYTFFWDTERPDWVTMYENQTGADIPPGPFDPLSWNRSGSFHDNPWSSEYMQTSLLEGGDITQTGALQVQIAAGRGVVVDNSNNIDANFTMVEWPTTTVNISFAASETIFLFIDNTGTIQTLSTEPGAASYRAMIYLGVAVVDPNNSAQIGGITFAPYASYLSQQTMQDLHRRLFTPCMDGGTVAGNAGTMEMSSSLLRIYSYASNWEVDRNDPHMSNVPPSNPITFTEVNQNFNIMRSNVPAIDPGNWDDSGTITPVTAGKFTVQRLFYSIPLGDAFVQPGQKEYDTISEAESEFEREQFNFAQPLTSAANSVVTAYVIVRNDASDLADGATAKVISGGCAFASGASSAIEFFGDLLDTNFDLPIKDDQAAVFNETTQLWENKFPNPFIRYYDRPDFDATINDFDVVFYNNTSNQWEQAFAGASAGSPPVSGARGQGIALNVGAGSPSTTDIQFFGLTEWPAHGLTVGTTYYLSDTVPGGIQSTPPSDPTSFQQPVFTVFSPDEVYIINWPMGGSDDPRHRRVVWEQQPADATVVNYEPVYYNSTNNRWESAQADNQSTLKEGVAINRINVGGNEVADIVLYGIIDAPAHGLPVGDIYYLSTDIPGQVVNAPPTNCTGYEQKVYKVITPDELMVIDDAAIDIAEPDPTAKHTIWTTRPVDVLVSDYEPVFYNDVSGLWEQAVASTETTIKQGIAVNVRTCGAGSPAGTLVADIVANGFINWPTHGLTVGTTYYLDATIPGGVTPIAPSGPAGSPPTDPVIQVVYQAIDADNIRVLDYQFQTGLDITDAIIKNPQTNDRNLIAPTLDVNPLRIEQMAGAIENPLEILSSDAGYFFTTDGKIQIDDSSTSPSAPHSSIEIGQAPSSPVSNALNLIVRDGNGINPNEFTLVNGAPRPIWTGREVELFIQDFDPAVDYNEGDKVIAEVPGASGSPHDLGIYRAISDKPAGSWNSIEWELLAGGGGVEFIGDLVDVDLDGSPGPTDGDMLVYDEIYGTWKNQEQPDGAISTVTDNADGTYTHNDGFGSPGIEVIIDTNKAVGDLTDVNLTTSPGPIDGEVLVYGGSPGEWTNERILSVTDNRSGPIDEGTAPQLLPTGHLDWSFLNGNPLIYKGTFDPNIDGGDNATGNPIIDGDTSWINGDTVVANSNGYYDTVTGLTCPTASPILGSPPGGNCIEITTGDWLVFNGGSPGIWEHVQSSDPASPNYIWRDNSHPPLVDISWGDNRLIELGDPIDDQDAVTKIYVDSRELNDLANVDLEGSPSAIVGQVLTYTGGSPGEWTAEDPVEVLVKNAIIPTGSPPGLPHDDLNNADFTGHPEAVGSPGAISIDNGEIWIFTHEGTAYIWTGPSNVTVGAGGDYTAVASDLTVLGAAQDPAVLINPADVTQSTINVSGPKERGLVIIGDNAHQENLLEIRDGIGVLNGFDGEGNIIGTLETISDVTYSGSPAGPIPGDSLVWDDTLSPPSWTNKPAAGSVSFITDNLDGTYTHNDGDGSPGNESIIDTNKYLEDILDVEYSVSPEIQEGDLLVWDTSVSPPRWTNKQPRSSALLNEPVDPAVVDLDAVRFDNNGSPATLTWVRAMADAEENVKQGVATNRRLENGVEVADIVFDGIIELTGHGLIGDTHWLSDTVPGGTTQIEPTGATTISQAVFEIIDVDRLRVIDHAIVIGASAGPPGTGSGPGGATSLNDLLDVSVIGATNQQRLTFIAANNRWEAQDNDMGDLTDVDTTGVTDRQAVVWDGTEFVPETMLTNVDDASVQAASDGDILTFGGSPGQWIAITPSAMGSTSSITDNGDGTYTHDDGSGGSPSTAIIDTNTPADQSEYDNTASGSPPVLTSTNVQDAIDELAARPTGGTLIDNGDGSYTFDDGSSPNVIIETGADSNPYDPTTSGSPAILTATNVQDAINEVAILADRTPSLIDKGDGTYEFDDGNGGSPLSIIDTRADSNPYDNTNISPNFIVGDNVQDAIDELVQRPIPELLDDLEDVDLTGSPALQPDQILRWDGMNWVPSNDEVSAMIDNGDGTYIYDNSVISPAVVIDTRADSNPYDNTNISPNFIVGDNVQDAIDELVQRPIPEVLSDLDDIDTTGAANGQMLIYSASPDEWVPVDIQTYSLTDNGDGTYTFDDGASPRTIVDTNADSNPFDPTTSGISPALAATDVQSAIDEVHQLVLDTADSIPDIIDNGDGTYTVDTVDSPDTVIDTRADSNPYDNTNVSPNPLAATNVQDAIDELASKNHAEVIDDLDDVDTTSVAPSPGDVLTWSGSPGQWAPQTGAVTPWDYENTDFTPAIFTKTLVDASNADLTVTLPTGVNDGEYLAIRLISNGAPASPLTGNVLLVDPGTEALNGEISSPTAFDITHLYRDLTFIYHSSIGWTVSAYDVNLIL